MEECEVLCSRLVIMVNGEFKCIGSPQHLKSKFGGGYKITIRLTNDDRADDLFNFMKCNFPTASPSQIHKQLFDFTIQFKHTKLSMLFKLIEKNREILSIKDYSITQTTLDQVFVNFANEQYDESVFDETGVVKNENFIEEIKKQQSGETVNYNKPQRHNSTESYENEDVNNQKETKKTLIRHVSTSNDEDENNCKVIELNVDGADVFKFVKNRENNHQNKSFLTSQSDNESVKNISLHERHNSFDEGELFS